MANDFWAKYYGSLEGATILSFEGMLDDIEGWGGNPFPTFRVRLTNGEIIKIEISQDEEGNGGGFIFGLALPESHPQGGEVRSINA